MIRTLEAGQHLLRPYTEIPSTSLLDVAIHTLKPYFIEMWPAARLINSLGTKSGETFLNP